MLAAAAVAWRTVATLRSLDDAALESQARLVARQLTTGPGGHPVLHLPEPLATAFSTSDGQSLYIVYDSDDAAAAASDPRAVDLVRPFLPVRPRTGYFRVPSSVMYPQGLLGTVRAVGTWRVVVAQGQEQNEVLVESLLRDFLLSALWLLLPIGSATVLIGVLTIRHGLRPLREASVAAGRVGPSSTDVRLPTAGLPAELTPLVGAMNLALARLERALTAQRRFVGSAAHALRTPLAVLAARIDALPAGAETDALRADVDRTTRLVGQMLTMARLEELPLDLSKPVNLHQVAVEAISNLAPLAIRRHVDLVLTEPPILPPVTGNHAAIVLALTNLLDNALAYAPPRSVVEVEVAASATLRVLDRGPGIPEPERRAIFERFQRGSGARPGGSGLGPTIVAEIATAHGGRAWVEPRDGGGAAFVLQFPGPLDRALSPSAATARR
jgi:signal transduction histidine kinase